MQAQTDTRYPNWFNIHHDNMNLKFKLLRYMLVCAGGEAGRALCGSESSLSVSSEADERYETCSSGASDAPDARPDTGYAHLHLQRWRHG